MCSPALVHQPFTLVVVAVLEGDHRELQEHDRNRTLVAELLGQSERVAVERQRRARVESPARVAVSHRRVQSQCLGDNRFRAEQKRKPPRPFLRVVGEPEVVERDRELQPELDLALGLRPAESSTEVALVRDGDVEALLAGGVEGEVRGDGEREEVLRVPPLRRFEVTGGSQALACVLADRLEHPVAIPGVANEALVDE